MAEQGGIASAVRACRRHGRGRLVPNSRLAPIRLYWVKPPMGGRLEKNRHSGSRHAQREKQGNHVRKVCRLPLKTQIGGQGAQTRVSQSQTKSRSQHLTLPLHINR